MYAKPHKRRLENVSVGGIQLSTLVVFTEEVNVVVFAALGKGCFNLLTPNVNYSGRTAPLTSKVAFYIFIQQI